MSDHHEDHGHSEDHGTYFDSSTVALGALYTVFVIVTLSAILIWG